MAQQSAGMPYIGSLISLISKTGVRYEGTLYTIDMVESTIALQDVRSFGTEGRKQDGPQIPASERPFEFIIFRGTDIADLTVITNGPPEGQQTPSAPPAQYQDQQVPQSHAPATQFGTNTEVPRYTPQGPPPSSNAPPYVPQPPASQPRPPQAQYHTPQPPQPTPAPTVSLTSQGSGQVRGQPRSSQSGQGQGPSASQRGEGSSPPQAAPSSATQAAQAAAAAAIAKPVARPSSFLQAAGGSTSNEGSRGPAGTPQPGRGGAVGPGAGRGRGRAPPRAPPVTVPNEDFDFEEMMKKFNKQALLKEADAKPEQPKIAEKPTFEDDFFDSISSDATERLAREDGRGRFAEQRKIDMETFGGAGMARRHQGGRGGYRGGRGGQQQGQGQGQSYQNGPGRGQGHGYQNGPARGQGQGNQNGPGRGGRGQGYQNASNREGSQGGGQGGRAAGGFQTVPSRGYRGGGRGGNAPRGRGRGRNAVPVAAQG